jgi:hypothetical protein
LLLILAIHVIFVLVGSGEGKKWTMNPQWISFAIRHSLQECIKTKERVTVQSNGGTLVAKRKATLQGYESDVWYDKSAITNILSLANVSKHLTFDNILF